MTKEELEKEAGDYADKHAFRVPYDGSNKFYDDVDFKASKEGYLAGAKPREKRIAELEQQINNVYNSGYLAGAESREKRIAELEKEKSEIINLINDCLWSCVNKNFDKVEEGLKSLLNEYDE